MKYWSALLSNNKIVGKLAKKGQEKFYNMVNELKDYDFTLFNIQQIVAQINSEIIVGIKNAIMDVFETLSAKHSYAEYSNNIYLFNGWKTNKAHKVNDKKVILPIWGIFSSYDGKPSSREAYGALGDIEKVFNYLNGRINDENNLYDYIENAFRRNVTKNICCKYFSLTFYKKGTVHISFNNPRDVDLLNIYAARNKNWLPPTYGKKHYANMDVEEKSVIDEFQGEEKYEDVVNNPDKYIFDIAENSCLLLSA